MFVNFIISADLKMFIGDFQESQIAFFGFQYYNHSILLLKGVLDVKPMLRHNTIVLCGFMGCGKTTIGKMLASALDYRFADTDEMLISETGKSIAQIFAESGESHFRDLEHQIVQKAAALSHCVISTGGGVMTFERNARLLAQHTTIVHIHRSFDDCYDAIRKRTNRPLSGSKSREELLSLYESRFAAYEKYAHYTLANNASAEAVAARLRDLILSRRI